MATKWQAKNTVLLMIKVKNGLRVLNVIAGETGKQTINAPAVGELKSLMGWDVTSV
jgi:hypothetical protein